MPIDIFEKGTRQNLTFSTTTNGVVNISDLWRIGLPNVRTLARSLRTQIKDLEDEADFLCETPAKNPTLELKFALVMRVFNVLTAEQAAAQKRAENKEKRSKILALMAEQDDEKLRKTNRTQLKKLLQEMDLEEAAVLDSIAD